METIEQLEDAVMHLSPDDYRRFYDWFIRMDHEKWDREIEEDAANGRLAAYAHEAVMDYRAGRCRRM
ncbi:MAG: hypothetical protein HZA20_05885 [Nitrospirae bacterium]|nr:hypothetical protein [Nitrospirota bacterium]